MQDNDKNVEEDAQGCSSEDSLNARARFKEVPKEKEHVIVIVKMFKIRVK